jgi:hypothetical protein
MAFKAIDASTDMVVVTSGYSYINYNRIVSSSASSYSVSTTDTQGLKDPSLRTSWESRGIYIIDKNNVKCLIFYSY